MDEQNHEYRTGRTSPKKNRSGPIAVLLILMIFLAGVVSALSLLNIRLFRQLDTPSAHPPVSFSKADAGASVSTDCALMLEGMSFQELPVLYRKMHDLPAGLYICRVDAGSRAEQLGIVAGDVLTCFGGTPVSGLDALETLINQHKPGDRVELIAYRNGRHNPFTLTLGEQE